jgi:hypothetical protein
VAARAGERPRLSDGERTQLRERVAAQSRSHAAAQSQARRTQLCEEIHALFRAANEHGRTLAGQDVFRVSTDSIDVLHRLMFEPVRSKREFDWWWGKLHQQFLECRDARIWERDQQYPIPAIRELLGNGSPQTGPLNHLRNWCSHTWLAPGNDQERKDFDSSLRRLRKILEEMIGRAVLEDEDEEGWVALQLALLQRLRDLITGVVKVFRTEGARLVAPPVAAAVESLIYVG